MLENIRRCKILLVDDDPNGLALLETILEHEGFVNVVGTTDPRRVPDLFEAFKPDIVLTDLHMPGINGLDVVSDLQERLAGDFVPVLMLTGDLSREAKLRALSVGREGLRFEALRQHRGNAPHPEPPRDPAPVPRGPGTQSSARSEGCGENERAREREVRDPRTTRSGGGVQRRRDRQTHATRGPHERAHRERIGSGDGRGRVDPSGRPAPRRRKDRHPGQDPLEAREADRRGVRLHEAPHGDRLGLLANSISPTLRMAETIALHHHERWDGTGYGGKSGEEIPLAGRIIAVADVLDALINERPYKHAWPLDQAVEEITGQRGKQFDPEVVDAFLGLADRIDYSDPVEIAGHHSSV